MVMLWWKWTHWFRQSADSKMNVRRQQKFKDWSSWFISILLTKNGMQMTYYIWLTQTFYADDTNFIPFPNYFISNPTRLIASRSCSRRLGLGYRLRFADRIYVCLVKQVPMPFLDVSRDVAFVLALITTVRTHQVRLFATLNVDVTQ